MSNRYKGGVISATPPTTSGPYADGAASGAWTLEQQMQVTAAGTWPTAGNIDPANIYIEYLFSTYLYTGNGSTQTITNGIDLSGKGGLIWTKARSLGNPNVLVDTARGARYGLFSNTTDANVDYGSPSTGVVSFGSTGYPIGSAGSFNSSGATYVSWTFRKQPKFFDVVTYSGNSIDGRQVSHSLGSSPGCVIIKSTSNAGDWTVWHRSLPVSATDPPLLKGITLNSTAAAVGNNEISAVSATTVTLTGSVNNTGQSYVMYLFAHDAGGFGLTGTDNVISCGSYTGNGSATGPEINLGYEPQYVLIKNASATGYWFTFDNMRGIATGGTDALLWPNVADAEANSSDNIDLTATGFKIKNSAGSINGSGNTLIYIAIRRGPMKVPTSGTSVFNATLSSAAASTKITTGFVPDTQIMMFPPSAGNTPRFYDRLRGINTTRTDVITQVLQGASTAAEASSTGSTRAWQNDGYEISSSFGSNQWIYWTFGRAPSFMDVVCYTGNSTAGRTVNHNLSVVPELMIVKTRSAADSWFVYSAALGNTKYLVLNSTAAQDTYGLWNNTTPTSSVFTLGVFNEVNGSTRTYVAYLFATCAGVSKVGSYTGTGTTKQVDCGFTGGARFVLIKRADSTGDWYVWDSARGIVAGNDPYLLLNSTAAEVTSTDYVDTYSAGFEISSTAPAAINASGGTFIFLAIA